MIDEILPFLGVIVNWQNIGFPKGEAAYVLRKVDELLEGHAVGRSFVVSGEKLFFIVDFVDVFPAAAGKRFEDGGSADVIKEAIPVDRIFQVVERFGSDVHVAGISLLGQENCFRDGDAELCGDRVIEKFVVGGPPKRVIDDVSSLENGML